MFRTMYLLELPIIRKMREDVRYKYGLNLISNKINN